MHAPLMLVNSLQISGTIAEDVDMGYPAARFSQQLHALALLVRPEFFEVICAFKICKNSDMEPLTIK